MVTDMKFSPLTLRYINYTFVDLLNLNIINTCIHFYVNLINNQGGYRLTFELFLYECSNK